ncbi:MAG TPA: FAD-linked oxidase C-terminal domain-containing protein [Ktedonobacterales bacterium]|nr:FAD-linked oxidase C-terminal domain-containing protein [Ktedonobacterales bacterium]
MLDPKLVAEMRAIVGAEGVFSDEEQVRTYETDGLASYRQTPALVVLPTTTAQVQAVVRLCHRERIPFVPRGSGTGLSGGALPSEGSVVIGTARMREILDVDLPNQRTVVQPGVINLWVTQRVAPDGYYYAPDPSSQQVCSIGGNIAENSGGAHCLKYGFTVNHVLGMKLVLPDGNLVEIGGPALDTPGYDLPGIVVGSEGTVGIATEITLRLMRKPETVQTLLAAFATCDEAGEAVSRIIAAGIVPAAAEIMDRLAIEAAEAAVHANYPDAQALLLVELDGPRTEVVSQLERVSALCREVGSTELRLATTDEERALMWKGRKSAFAAVGRISPNYIVQDGVIPRTALPEILREIAEMSAAAGLRVANVFHAGDGNLHPLVLYDERDEGAQERAEELAGEIIRRCVAHGGSITGEHGVGWDKKDYMPVMFEAADLATHQLVRCALDPEHLCNPGKVYPTPRLCGETPGPYRPHPVELAGLGERF